MKSYPTRCGARAGFERGEFAIGDTIEANGERLLAVRLRSGIVGWEKAPEGAGWDRAGAVDVIAAPPTQAMRANDGKPDLAYLLSFAGFDHRCWAGQYADAVAILGQWYRGELDSVAAAVDAFADACDETWPELLACVSMFGAQKYARGNYLLGRGLHDTCASLLRHVYKVEVCCEHIDSESQIEHDGHIMWNVLFLLHCASTEIGVDDRLRPPAPK